MAVNQRLPHTPAWACIFSVISQRPFATWQLFISGRNNAHLQLDTKVHLFK